MPKIAANKLQNKGINPGLRCAEPQRSALYIFFDTKISYSDDESVLRPGTCKRRPAGEWVGGQSCLGTIQYNWDKCEYALRC